MTRWLTATRATLTLLGKNGRRARICPVVSCVWDRCPDYWTNRRFGDGELCSRDILLAGQALCWTELHPRNGATDECYPRYLLRDRRLCCLSSAAKGGVLTTRRPGLKPWARFERAFPP